MRNKKWLKNITALVMSIVLLVTTVPLVLAADITPQAYNPAPIFSDEAREQGAAAWLEEDGDIMVEFPSAEGGLTYQGYKQREEERQTIGDAGVEAKTYEAKEIAAYVLELYDLGEKLTYHLAPQNPVTINIDAAGVPVGYAASSTISARIPKAKIDEKFANGIDLTNRRYSVTITAVDKDGWLSRELYTYVSDVPLFSLTDEEMRPMTADEHAMREMMRFEGRPSNANSNNYSDYGNGSKRLDYIQTGDSVSVKGKVEQAGTINAQSNITTDTGAFRILITGAPNTGGQSVETAWSRETWDYEGAEEVWFWFDLSQVDMKGISFRLRSNEKQWQDYGGNDTRGAYLDDNHADFYGTLYSTLGTTKAGYHGESPYVYVQQEDGSWKKVALTNGTIDLAHFQGYVRVPLKFFCSEENTYVQVSNKEMGKGTTKNFVEGGWFTSTNEEKALEWMNKMYFRDESGNLIDVLVDEAGTPVSDALLRQRRGNFYHQHSAFGWFNRAWGKTQVTNENQDNPDAFMLAPGFGAEQINGGYTSVEEFSKREDGTYAFIEGTTGYKAINDLMSAGFAYTGISEDSINQSVYLDNIMFFRTDGGKYPEASISGEVRIGVPISTYFNQKEAIQEALFNAIDKYISSSPNCADYRAVKYIANMINNYKRVYEKEGQYDNFLDFDKDINSSAYGQGAMMDAANALGRKTAWQKYLDARKACLTEGTIRIDIHGNVANDNNSAVNDLVPNLIKTMEKLPAPDTVTQVSPTLRSEIIKLYRIYSRLNLGQLNLLGEEEETRLINYFNLVINAIQGGFVTGKELANMPFIPFNTFEDNTQIGEQAYRLENDPNINGDADYRRTKSVFTYSTDDGYYLVANVDKGILDDPKAQSRANSAWAYITDQGFKNSKGATVTIDADFTGGADNGTWHTITVAKNSTSAANLDDRAAKNMKNPENLGGLSGQKDESKLVGMDAGVMPLSLVFYVDFSNLTNFRFTSIVYSRKEDGTHIKLRPDMGVDAADAGDKELWRAYYMMDSETGEWKRVQTDNRYSFSSESKGVDADKIAKLDNYKGYIAIPLQHFKRAGLTTGKDRQLDYEAPVLENIYAIQFCIAGNDATIDNSTFTIDNIGFTYNKAKYDELGLSTGRTDKTYAEWFGAKSNVAEDFEQAVQAIDPYASDADLAAAIANADAIYDSLGSYQLTLQSVIQAKAELEKYRDGSFETQYPKSDMTVAGITDAINALPDLAKNASTVDSFDLPYPGYNADGTVNYAGYGFTDMAQAQAVVDLYEKHYKCMADADVATITQETKTALINAYGAAIRCLSLEAMKTDVIGINGADGFLPSLTGIYNQHTKDEAQTKYVSIENRDTVYTEWDRIYNSIMLYYAKAQLASGSMGDGLKPYQTVNTGIPRFYGNARSTPLNVGVTLSDGATSTQGGIVELKEKYTAVYNMAKEKITAQTLFTADELQQIADAIGEYESLLPAYHDVTDLYNVIEDIKHLFPVNNVSLDKEEVTYTKENWNVPQTATYSIAYSESLPIPSDAELNKIKLTAANGTLTNALNETAEYNVTVTFNGTSYTYTGAQLLAGVTLDTAVTNNAAAQNMQIQLNLPSQPTVANMISDTLTIELLDKDGNVVQSRSGAADATTGWNALENVPSKTVTFNYSQGDTYTITIPAEISIPWNSTESYEAGYSVETSLAEGSKVAVSVSNDGTNTLTESTNTYTLGYTPTNFGTKKEFTGITTADLTGAADCPKITVSGWDQVAIGEYRTILTYTVEYTSGS